MAAKYGSHVKNLYRLYDLKLYKANKFHYPLNAVIFKNSICLTFPRDKLQYEVTKYTGQTKPGEKKDVSCALPSSYSPQYVEAAWYNWWLKKAYFSPDTQIGSERSPKGTFVLCLPPPNVTGTLHLGHALTCSIQDAIVRWNRMRGLQTVWIPGCDHAGIATQVVVEKQLWKEEKKVRHDVGRDEFLKRVWEWKNKKGEIIYDQMKKLGISIDWDRACFTMDEKMTYAVNEAFIRLHEDGLIYRGEKLVNWSCHLKSTVSDIEVENMEIVGPTKLNVPGYSKAQTFGELVSFSYPVVNSDEFLTVTTTRLETMLGDTAVAVHPDDKRYIHLHHKHVRHPFDGRMLPIICDECVQKEFGTGAVKITPSHDHNDYEIGLKYKLPFMNVIGDGGEMEDVPVPFAGMKRFDARREVAKLLQDFGLFKGKQPHKMVLPICSRSKDIIEPRMKYQWFLNCKEMAEQAVKVVKTGKLSFEPEFYKKIWYEFLMNEKSRDWCISRQIWWGHRVPAYKITCTPQNMHKKVTTRDSWVAAHNKEDAVEKVIRLCKLDKETAIGVMQDEDVLDTWFSSALFPFSVQGWPNQTEDLARFYPCSLLETGNDILFFWVARMVMLGLKLTGQLPFPKVLLHGILRDAQGRKMSKSLGNVVDPMDVIQGITLQDLHRQIESGNLDQHEVETAKRGQKRDFLNGIPECGTDALRFALCSYNFKDPEININILHVQSYRHFCNKIWQGFRLVSEKLGPNFKPSIDLKLLSALKPVDLWILCRLTHMVYKCDRHFSSYDLHFVTQELYSFWLQDFCDVYLEYIKKIFQSNNEGQITVTKEILYLCMDTFLRAISPFMPYLSEELYQRLLPVYDSICIAPYPASNQYQWYSDSLNKDIDRMKDITSKTLSIIQALGLARKSAEVYITADQKDMTMLEKYVDVIDSLLKVNKLTLMLDKDCVPQGCICKNIENVQINIKIQGLVNYHKEIQKVETKLTILTNQISLLTDKLQNKNVKNDAEDHPSKITKLQSDMSIMHQYLTVLQKLNDLER